MIWQRWLRAKRVNAAESLIQREVKEIQKKNQKKEGETRQQQLTEKKEREARQISFFGINEKKERPLVQLNQIQVAISY
jgi:hypothetical protein